MLGHPPARAQKKVQRFSCEYDCHYCPNHPEQPRSYLPDEPGCRRATQWKFDAVNQVRMGVFALCALSSSTARPQLVDRVSTLEKLGHPVDKLEVLVLGGTWQSYPIEYRKAFIRDLFWAANTYFDGEVRGAGRGQASARRFSCCCSPSRAQPKRAKLSLAEEQALNENNFCKIIGLTLETRPDTINESSIRELRMFGARRPRPTTANEAYNAGPQAVRACRLAFSTSITASSRRCERANWEL